MNDNNESDVEFIDVENRDTVVNRSYTKSVYSPLINWLLEKQVVRSEKTAHTIVVAAISLLFLLSVFFVYIGLKYTSYKDSDMLLRPGDGFTPAQNR